MMATINDVKVATFKILYAEHPEKVGECFVEVRMWETADDAHAELIVEYGQMDISGDVITTSKVMPFYMTVREVLQAIRE